MAEFDDDADCVARAEMGDRAAFEVLVSRHRQSVTMAAYSVLNDLDAAQDCVQEAFKVAAASLANLSDRRRFGLWIQGIARLEAMRIKSRRPAN